MKKQSNTVGDICVAIMALCVVLFSVSMPYAATSITSSTSVNGKTLRLSAIANGDTRSSSLPCADGSVRQCASRCNETVCTVGAGWTEKDGQSHSAGDYAFAKGQPAAPERSAHQWCLSLLNSMGAPIGSGGDAQSTVRTMKRNGQASINGYSCPAALEPGMFTP